MLRNSAQLGPLSRQSLRLLEDRTLTGHWVRRLCIFLRTKSSSLSCGLGIWKLLPQGSAGDSGVFGCRIGYSLIASTLFYHPFEIFAVIAIILALTFVSIKKKRGGRSGQIDGAKRQLHMNKDVALVKNV